MHRIGGHVTFIIYLKMRNKKIRDTLKILSLECEEKEE
jgi:hypothetical protein